MHVSYQITLKLGASSSTPAEADTTDDDMEPIPDAIVSYKEYDGNYTTINITTDNRDAVLYNLWTILRDILLFGVWKINVQFNTSRPFDPDLAAVIKEKFGETKIMGELYDAKEKKVVTGEINTVPAYAIDVSVQCENGYEERAELIRKLFKMKGIRHTITRVDRLVY